MAGFFKTIIDVVSLNILKPRNISPHEMLKASNNLDFESNIKRPAHASSSKSAITETTISKLNISEEKIKQVNSTAEKNEVVKVKSAATTAFVEKLGTPKTLPKKAKVAQGKTDKLTDKVKAEKNAKKAHNIR